MRDVVRCLATLLCAGPALGLVKLRRGRICEPPVTPLWNIISSLGIIRILKLGWSD
jgi:hypothetical protein